MRSLGTTAASVAFAATVVFGMSGSAFAGSLTGFTTPFVVARQG